MKRFALLLLSALALFACNSKKQAPLLGNWKLAAVTVRPETAKAEKLAPGTIFSFRPDSTLVVGAQPPVRYEVQRLPEGMFLRLSNDPPHLYRIVAMTPAELSLQEDTEERRVNLQLQFQKQ